MQRVYGEFIINETASENVVSLIKEYEIKNIYELLILCYFF